MMSSKVAIWRGLGVNAVAHHVKPGDLKVGEARITVATEAVEWLRSGQSPVLKKIYTSGGRPVMRCTKRAERIGMRALAKQIRRVTNAWPWNRRECVRSLLSALKEPCDLWIDRRDIKDFFASINKQLLLEQLSANSMIDALGLTRLVNSVLEASESCGFGGLPPGLPISSALADYFMLPVDTKAISGSEVLLYRRFVDDIVLVRTSFDGPALKLLDSGVAKLGLKLHESPNSKYVSEQLPRIDSNEKEPVDFDYLGYRFTAYGAAAHESDKRPKVSKPPRKVDVGLSRNKISSMKKKLFRAAADFGRTGDVSLLVDRMNWLSGSVKIYSMARSYRRTGLRYTHPLIAINASLLADLDRHYHGPHWRRLNELAQSRSKVLPSSLRSVSFAGRTNRRTRFEFSEKRARQVQECWRHV